MRAIIKKELKSYFLSPIGYIIIGIFLFVFSTFFYLTTVESQNVNLALLFDYTAIFGLMFIIPLITMWSISGERKSGTEQLIMTAPVSMLGVVIAKFIASILLIIIPLIFTLMYFGILCFFQVPNIPIYLTSMLGFLLLSMSYISIGILSSSLTESPVISGILTLGFIVALTWGPEIPFVKEKIQERSFMELYINFLYGKIDIPSTVMFVTITALCLILTMIILQRRKSIK